MTHRIFRIAITGIVALLLGACGAEEEPGGAVELNDDGELGIGAVDDLKADGAWGPATECKQIPAVEPLTAPEIIVSLDGLTLHLVDEATGYDAVFPIGPGAIKDGVSLTPLSIETADQLFHLRLDKPIGVETANPDYSPWSYAYSCRIWWLNGDTGQRIPVFAGLPFMRLEGAPTLAYAIHGPVDSYTLPTGGKLTRGYVSHGCIRMEAADLVEVYGRCLGRKVPVRVQRSVERRADGAAVEVPARWILSECTNDADCNFEGGLCRTSAYSGRGICTKACMQFCPDRAGYPTSFCATDPEDDGAGLCTLKASSLNNDCKRYPGQVFSLDTPRFNQPGVLANVCLPGSEGWIGEACLSDLDCVPFGGACLGADAPAERPGFCSEGCSKYCPDATGQPGTFCVDGGDGGGTCMQKCVLQDDCPFGYSCEADIPRFGESEVTADVCQ